MASTTTTTTVSAPEAPTFSIVKTFGNYKEQASGAKAYNRKLEEEGDAEHPKAKVCRHVARILAELNAIPAYRLSAHMGSK